MRHEKVIRHMISGAAPAVLAGWFAITVLSQHPDRGYDRLRNLDRTGTGILIPNWRFFAPDPAVEDQHFLYRLASEDRRHHTEWRAVNKIAHRRAAHAFWFPGRRVEKAIFDVAATLLSNPGTKDPAVLLARNSARALVSRFVQTRIRPEAEYPLFQVMLVRYAGYDHSEEPKYDMVFDYERMDSA
ncbi:hypothetical protein I6J42_34120 (plasmid) [Streptomyces californicus]|uniref:Uncharacterized protein n=1 Tax=Streptomyces californicus TaxID=67351 RepID=A0ABD7D8G5_9ACTN|nr:hypothetical protein [Streptomyces californicus]QRV39126.1 hypothetical protein I6J42_34120 [Streptomyces californicus]QRV52579.1 hypothetical protein I6J43_34140 [Streptomyces californicus]